MLRLTQPQLEIWDAILPEGVGGLSEELVIVDRYLEDEQFLLPFRKKFSTTKCRPTIPVEQYLRLMFLKHRYQMGYEVLVREVSDSLQWRRFCRISLASRVPHSTALIKITHKVGDELIGERFLLFFGQVLLMLSNLFDMSRIRPRSVGK